ncbi:MAG: hypothetical protein LBU34_15660 [Planctomycetaceae bacterium]|jgi:hypothetical protein|nr:hypothetical protein [Planctomycetaceae bacterium]
MIFRERFLKRIEWDNLDNIEKRAETKNGAGLFENGWIPETEEKAWKLVCDVQREYFEEYGDDSQRSQLFYCEFNDARAELQDIAQNRLPPLSPFKIEKALLADGIIFQNVLRMRNQPTGDCVGNGTSRAIEALLLDMRAQKYEVLPRPIHPSYCYAGARSLSGSRRGAGANVALAGKFVFENGILFEDTEGVKSYDDDRRMSSRLGRYWDSREMKELIGYAAPFRVSVIRLPSRSPMTAINLALDAGAKIVGGFRRKFVSGGDKKQGVKFARLLGNWNHCVSILGRFNDPVDGYIWGNSHGNKYPGSCVLGTPEWATNLSPADTAAMCEGASLYAVIFVQFEKNTSKADWRPMPIV